ncbi:hypothetical protein C8Q73DRAFT_483616 [Cubamyces lactineus]|nr:hypothetical protein C8Q73DRAFT_483616 [Cubamyces lactineus]
MLTGYSPHRSRTARLCPHHAPCVRRRPDTRTAPSHTGSYSLQRCLRSPHTPPVAVLAPVNPGVVGCSITSVWNHSTILGTAGPSTVSSSQHRAR